MSDKPRVTIRTILHFFETRVPKIILQRVEEFCPDVLERMVSVVCTESSLYHLVPCVLM
jgi:hypothetical protein